MSRSPSRTHWVDAGRQQVRWGCCTTNTILTMSHTSIWGASNEGGLPMPLKIWWWRWNSPENAFTQTCLVKCTELQKLSHGTPVKNPCYFFLCKANHSMSQSFHKHDILELTLNCQPEFFTVPLGNVSGMKGGRSRRIGAFTQQRTRLWPLRVTPVFMRPDDGTRLLRPTSHFSLAWDPQVGCSTSFCLGMFIYKMRIIVMPNRKTLRI